MASAKKIAAMLSGNGNSEGGGSSRHGGSDFLPNFVEYITPLKEAKYILPKRLMLIGLLCVLVLAVFVTVFVFVPMLAPFVPIMLILIVFLGWYLWRFVSVEHEYTILQGEISFDVIYGRRQRKKAYSAPIRNIEAICYVKDRAPQMQGIQKELFLASYMKKDNTAYAVVREENGTKTLFYFEMIEKAEKALRFYNSSAFLNR